ncbi:MAG: ATP-grasp domain-containing protein [Alkalibacterium sp.]|nr:ATP-grasp domain-containing protein [Alkalibacterium sp.]
MTNWIQPGSTIGIIGGGSVARLLAIAAKRLGYSIGILDPDDTPLAAPMADWHMKADLNNDKALNELAMKSNVVIYESEAVHHEAIKKIRRTVPVPQGEEILTVSQDRVLQKAFLESVRVNIAPYATIVSLSDIEEAVQGIGFPCVLKTNTTDERFKDHLILYEENEIKKAEDFLSQGTCVLEAWIPADKELCIGLVKDRTGSVATYPVNEMRYSENNLVQSIAPARISDEMRMEVERIGVSIAEALSFVGVIALELFSIESGALYVNEIVAHPHRSNHYTSDFSDLSQYETHVKAITGWPLSLEHALNQSVVMQLLDKKHEHVAFTQAQLKPDWVFTFYENHANGSTTEAGYVTVKTENVSDTLVSLKEIFE